jgi:YjbE family integral membrane protein
MFAAVGSLIGIIILNITLSGDNALMIAMAARGLQPRDRKRAILVGGAMAMVLRIALTALATLLLNIPLLQATGGLLLVWITIRLLRGEPEIEHRPSSMTLGSALGAIMIADFLMSLDNVLAIAGAARGSLVLLVVGVALSMPIVLLGANGIAHLFKRFSALLYIGAATLAFTAAHMVLDDQIVEAHLEQANHLMLLVLTTTIFGLIALGPRLVREKLEQAD